MRRLLGPIALLAILVATVGADATGAAECRGGEAKTVDVGIAKLVGCFETTEVGEDTIHTARFADQPEGDVDLNGFFVASAYPGDGAIRVSEREQSVTAVALDDSLKPVNVQLRSLNVPVSGQKTDLGGATKLAFVAPNFGELLLDDLRLFSNGAWARALAGFLPGNAEVPILIGEDGKGSMNLLLEATGALALKGKPQSASVNITTESGKGTQLDGFELSVNEFSFGDYLSVNNLSAYYSAADRELRGDAEATWPFPRPGGKAGFKVGATLTDGRLRRLQVGANNLVIPIGTAGIIKSLSGGFESGDKDDIKFNVGAGAALGPPMWTPDGGVGDRPVGANAVLTAGSSNGAKFVRVDGDVSFMNIPLGDAKVGIYFDAGIDIGARLGIGLPSVRNNENDPFYIGAKVNGWIAGSGFQFDGSARLALLGYRLADAQVLVNNRAIGACAELLWFDVGAAYEWGRGTDIFGSSCGLARYRQKFPTAATSAAGGGRRMIRLDRNEALLRVTGEGGAPRFRLRSPDGRVLSPPASGYAAVGKDSAYFLNESENETVVAPPRNRRRWEVIPLPGSPAITGFQAAKVLPPERVRARVRGKGRTRTLTWDSTGNPNTRLVFSEEMPGGREKPILTTDKASGRFRFKPANHGNYGLRKLQVAVLHNGTPREVKKVAAYRIDRPGPIHGPRRVRAWRAGTTVHVKWPRVRGAAGYLVEVKLGRGKGRPISVLRRTGPRKHRVRFPEIPSGGRGTARVFALNADGATGKPGKTRFRTGTSIRHLRPAAQAALDSARRAGGAIALRTVCPRINLHCRIRLTLKFRGRVVARASFQQAPDTFRHVKLRPKKRALRARIRRGRLHGFRIEIAQSRYGGHHRDQAPVR